MRRSRVESYGNIELRFVEGRLDEVLLFNQDKTPVFHLEWMNENCYWVGLSGTKSRVDIFFDSREQINFKIVRK